MLVVVGEHGGRDSPEHGLVAQQVGADRLGAVHLAGAHEPEDDLKGERIAIKEDVRQSALLVTEQGSKGRLGVLVHGGGEHLKDATTNIHAERQVIVQYVRSRGRRHKGKPESIQR